MLDLDKKTFEDEVLKADGYVFVDFYGDGCVPCQALMPKVHEFADTYGDKHVVWLSHRRCLDFRLWRSTKMEKK